MLLQPKARRTRTTLAGLGQQHGRDEAQVLHNTHLEQLASCIRKMGHLVNLAAHQWSQ